MAFGVVTFKRLAEFKLRNFCIKLLLTTQVKVHTNAIYFFSEENLNPLPKSDQHQVSLNNINTKPREIEMRITKMIA